jgi:hypothetical protein
VNDLKPRRPYSAEAANPPAEVPEAQRQALQRRANLDEQQRSFGNGIPDPHFQRRRPPG